ncbi:MAG TPA: serine hydrolase domain-containing protein [Pseudomonadales bacterium]|nr:serine hydrolase domain-containing protein [Pseudomonadales bacterium]
MKIGGGCAEGFGAVADAFARNFSTEGEIGAACAVYHQGRQVVDLWGGVADTQSDKPWRQDTLCGFYSTGKPIAALGLLRCVDVGLIALDDVVASVWPEFAANGKAAVTFRHLLTHQAGLPAIARRMPEGAMFDWSLIVNELAAQAPWFVPGSRHVYHTNTFGYLVGEPLRRLTGLTPNQYVQREIAGAIGEQLYFGVPEDALERCATLYWENGGGAPDPAILDMEMTEEQRMLRFATMNPTGFSSMGVMNTRQWRQAEVPSTNGHGTARAVARIYSALAAGGEDREIRLLSNAMLGEATRIQSSGYCPNLDREVDFGLALQLTRPERPFGPNPGAYGHFGTGGSVGFADPVTGIGFGYVMNQIKPRWQSPRNRNLIQAVYASLALQAEE